MAEIIFSDLETAHRKFVDAPMGKEDEALKEWDELSLKLLNEVTSQEDIKEVFFLSPFQGEAERAAEARLEPD